VAATVPRKESNRANSVGDPDTLIERIPGQRAATGDGVLVIRPEMGDMPLDEVAAGLELFFKEVLPAIRNAQGFPKVGDRRWPPVRLIARGSAGSANEP